MLRKKVLFILTSGAKFNGQFQSKQVALHEKLEEYLPFPPCSAPIWCIVIHGVNYLIPTMKVDFRTAWLVYEHYFCFSNSGSYKCSSETDLQSFISENVERFQFYLCYSAPPSRLNSRYYQSVYSSRQLVSVTLPLLFNSWNCAQRELVYNLNGS